jgi:hypothetical protein
VTSGVPATTLIVVTEAGATRPELASVSAPSSDALLGSVTERVAASEVPAGANMRSPATGGRPLSMPAPAMKPTLPPPPASSGSTVFNGPGAGYAGMVRDLLTCSVELVL